MSEWAIRTLRRVASDLRVFEDGRRISEDILDAFVTCLELVYRDLIAQEHMLDTNGREACELVRRSLTHLRALQDESTQLSNYDHWSSQFEIPCEQLVFLVESRFTGPQIADILGVSLSTSEQDWYFISKNQPVLA